MDSTVLDAGIAAQQLQLVNAIVDEDRQYATRLTITRTDNENASESVISTVISWLMKKKVLSKEHCDSFREGTYSTPDGWNGTTELEQGKTALASKRKRLCARPVIELTTMREYADVHDALKFGSRYVDWKKIVAICDAKGEPTSEATRWRGERWFWKDDWKKNIKLKSGERIKDMQPVICYERGRCDYSVLELTRWYGFDHKSLLNSGKKGIVFDGLTWRLLRYDVDFEKRLKETPLICRETGKTFDTLQGELFITDAQYMVAAGRWIIANGHLPTTDPLSIHSELTYICQQYPICILVAVLYDTFGEMSVRLFFALLDMVAVLFIWYQTFPKAGNRILHCAVSCVFGAVIVYSLRSTPRALDILCLAVSWELMEKYIKSRDIRFLFGFPFLGVFIANLHGALWPCAIMLPLAALLDSKLDSNARIALAVTVLLTIASAMLNPYGLDVLSLPFKTIGTSDVATVAVPELKPMFSIVPVEAVILIVISVVPVIFHAKCLGFKKAVFSFETMMISGLLFLSLMTWRNELLLLGILMIVYSTWCWKLEPKCKVSSKMLSRIVLFSISVVALEFGAVLFYSTLSATDQKSISIERAFQAMREDGAVSGTAVLTDIDPGCRAELNGFKPYLDTRIEVFNGQNGQKNVLAEAGKALSSGSLSAI